MAAFATETRAKHFSSVGEADALLLLLLLLLVVVVLVITFFALRNFGRPPRNLASKAFFCKYVHAPRSPVILQLFCLVLIAASVHRERKDGEQSEKMRNGIF